MCDGDGWFLLVGNLDSHWTMNTKCSCSCNDIKQHRDITMPYQPFGMFLEYLQGNPVQQVHGTVSPPVNKIWL